MTDPLFFDTDCLSAFLWINDQSLLSLLYPGRIVIPAEVYAELSRPSVPHLKERVDGMLGAGAAVIGRIQTGTEEYTLFRKMISHPDPGHIPVGRGEASAIVLARYREGIVASNNLRDISLYIAEFGLRHITTGEILRDALEKQLITESEGNALWGEMLRKRRRLGYDSFSSYLQSQDPDSGKER